MTVYRIARRLLRPLVRPIARWLQRFRQEHTRGQFAHAGPDVLFGDDVTVIGGERISLGDRLRVMSHVYFWATPRGAIEIGDGTYLGEYTHIVANEKVTIGKGVLLAPFCYIQDTDHGFERTDVPIAEQPANSSPIVIEDDVWVGAHTVITRGVTVGHGAVIGANSVVTRDVEPYAVVAGSPARQIRSRRPSD